MVPLSGQEDAGLEVARLAVMSHDEGRACLDHDGLEGRAVVAHTVAATS